MDHRVEPPSWLPQGAAPKAADPEADEAPASDDAHALQDDSAPADSAAEDFPNGNGHDGSYTYSRDDSYSYSQESPYAARGSYEDPAAKPPFHDLPSAAFELPSAPPPPGDEVADSGYVSSGVSAGLPDGDFGADGSDAGPSDSGYSGGFSGSSGLGGGSYSSGGGAMGRADSGLGGGDSYTPHYAPEFPPAPAPSSTGGREVGSQGTQRAGHTTYAYPPPASAPPPTAPVRGRGAATQARRANLVVARLEPWSVMKFSFLISLVAWIVLFVAVALLYYALSSLGVFASLQKTLASVTSSQGSAGIDLSKWTSETRILGYTMLIGAIDVVLITALSTLGAVVYNLVTHLGGGIEVTLKETE